VGSYLAHGPELYLKAHENPRAFSCISGPIFLESSIQFPFGVGLHQWPPYKNSLIRGILLLNEDEVRRTKLKGNYYVILDGKLFNKGLTTTLLKFLNKQQVDYVMREFHKGICVLYTRRCSLATKAVWADYYWPTLKVDTLDFTRRCRRCHDFADVPHTPPVNLHSLSSLWSFAMWGMDILGPLPKAPGAVKYILVAIDYFTKWIKARPLREITANEVEKFTWKHLICRFCLPYAIVTDNETQFKAQTYEDFLKRLGIKHLVTSVEHPQTNGQAEATNKVILKALRTRLDLTTRLVATILPF